MAKEMERKFLVVSDDFRKNVRGTFVRQGYLKRSKKSTVRVRVAENKAFITIKSESKGMTRNEYEYGIPVYDAMEILDTLCEGFIIEKTRYLVDYEGNRWFVDEFHGNNGGLIIAEIELTDEDQPFEKPSWTGDEVTGDNRYFNSNLSKRPYSTW